jgi:hypothetical protein
MELLRKAIKGGSNAFGQRHRARYLAFLIIYAAAITGAQFKRPFLLSFIFLPMRVSTDCLALKWEKRRESRPASSRALARAQNLPKIIGAKCMCEMKIRSKSAKRLKQRHGWSAKVSLINNLAFCSVAHFLRQSQGENEKISIETL